VLKDRGGHWCLDIEVANRRSWLADTTCPRPPSETRSCRPPRCRCGGRMHREYIDYVRCTCGGRLGLEPCDAGRPSSKTGFSPRRVPLKGDRRSARAPGSSRRIRSSDVRREARPCYRCAVGTDAAKERFEFLGAWHSSGRSSPDGGGISGQQARSARGERPVPRGTDQAVASAEHLDGTSSSTAPPHRVPPIRPPWHHRGPASPCFTRRLWRPSSVAMTIVFPPHRDLVRSLDSLDVTHPAPRRGSNRADTVVRPSGALAHPAETGPALRSIADIIREALDGAKPWGEGRTISSPRRPR